MNYWITGVFILCFSAVFGQKERHVSLELAGVGGYASVNLETEFKRYNHFGLEYRVGFGAAYIDEENGTSLVFPLLIHSTYGQGKHKADLGLGQAITVTTEGEFFARGVASLGYRIQPEDKNFFIRFAYTPIISYIYNFQWEHWGGVTFGFKLKKS